MAKTGSRRHSMELNSLGTAESRKGYRAILVEYFNDHTDSLDEDSILRLEKNPMRILDSKNPEMDDVIHSAPKMNDHLDQESEDHFNGLLEYLDGHRIQYVLNPRLVRGLDYYTKTVFEWTTDKLGAQPRFVEEAGMMIWSNNLVARMFLQSDVQLVLKDWLNWLNYQVKRSEWAPKNLSRCCWRPGQKQSPQSWQR